MRGVVNDALAVYFLDATVAAAKDVPMAFQVIRSTSDGKVVFVHEQAEQFGTFPFPDFTKNPPDLGHGIECALAALDDQKSGHTAVELIRDRSMLVHMVPISARRMVFWKVDLYQVCRAGVHFPENIVGHTQRRDGQPMAVKVE